MNYYLQKTGEREGGKEGRGEGERYNYTYISLN